MLLSVSLRKLYSEDFFHNPTTFDEIERFHSIYMPNETIIIHSSYEKIDDVIAFSGIDSKSIHVYEADQYKQFEKQIYQKDLLKRFYKFRDYDSFYDSLPFKELERLMPPETGYLLLLLAIAISSGAYRIMQMFIS